jgi:putative ABC transport system substrate-binding protein
VGAKRLELLRELVPIATRVAVLIDPANAAINESTLRDVEASARAMGLQIHVMRVSTSQEISAAFASFVRERPDTLFVAPSPFLGARRVQLALLAALHRIPAVYPTRNFVDVGGLISYGADLTNAYRQMGIYTGRILKGAKPADLPVVQSTKFELVINAETARILGLTVPHSLLSRADEVIE